MQLNHLILIHKSMKKLCMLNDKTCPYHACLSNGCQKEQVKESGANWGLGKCEETNECRFCGSYKSDCICGELFYE